MKTNKSNNKKQSKKLIAIVAACVMLLNMLSISTYAHAVDETMPKAVKHGDVNGSGVIGVEDVVLLQKHLAKITRLSNEQIIIGDLDLDGQITLTDIVLLQKYIAKLILMPVTQIWHEAEYEYIEHPAETTEEWVVDQAAISHEEPVYETVNIIICNACEADVTSLSQDELNAHMEAHILVGEVGTWRSETKEVQIGTETIVTVPEIGHYETTVTKEAWTEKVLVKEGYWEYVKQTSVWHNAEYKYVNHPAETKQVWVVDQAASSYEEPVYETVNTRICRGCNGDITSLSQSEISAHLQAHMLAGENGSWYSSTKDVQIGSEIIITVPEKGHYETVTKEAWTEKILVKEGYWS
ncbi:hypothetical protein AGMMS50284_4260 [Clostridia bacterium]|nr:hypothetical protein AGMMS50284_4260 [Clostridia bacterium]